MQRDTFVRESLLADTQHGLASSFYYPKTISRHTLTSDSAVIKNTFVSQIVLSLSLVSCLRSQIARPEDERE